MNQLSPLSSLINYGCMLVCVCVCVCVCLGSVTGNVAERLPPQHTHTHTHTHTHAHARSTSPIYFSALITKLKQHREEHSVFQNNSFLLPEADFEVASHWAVEKPLKQREWGWWKVHMSRANTFMGGMRFEKLLWKWMPVPGDTLSLLMECDILQGMTLSYAYQSLSLSSLVVPPPALSFHTLGSSMPCQQSCSMHFWNLSEKSSNCLLIVSPKVALLRFKINK